MEHYTNDLWCIYFHDPYDENWALNSYVRLATMSSVEEFWQVQKQMKEKVHCGMFFLMREHVFPCWDDEHNREGGCLSIKVLKQDMKEFWEKLCVKLLGETLVVPTKRSEFWDNVNGISTSPKKHFCIIKIWLKSDKLTEKGFFEIPENYHGDILFRSNIENIEHNNQALLGDKGEDAVAKPNAEGVVATGSRTIRARGQA